MAVFGSLYRVCCAGPFPSLSPVGIFGLSTCPFCTANFGMAGAFWCHTHFSVVVALYLLELHGVERHPHETVRIAPVTMCLHSTFHISKCCAPWKHAPACTTPPSDGGGTISGASKHYQLPRTPSRAPVFFQFLGCVLNRDAQMCG